MAKIELNSNLAIYTNDSRRVLANSANRRLIISTHGGWSEGDGTFSPRSEFGVVVSFYAKENYAVTGDIEDALGGTVQTIDSPAASVKNYELTRFEHDPDRHALAPHLNDNFDVLKVRSRWIGPDRTVRLREALRVLQTKGYRYPEICCLFCRYTGDELEMDARQRTQGETERLNALSKANALNQELKQKFAAR